MLAPEPVAAWRLVAQPAALDTASWPAGSTVLRLAPDDVLLLAPEAPSVDDTHAIVEPDAGWSVLWLTPTDFADHVAPHIEWELPAAGALGQGKVAGVPAKVLIRTDLVLVACQSCFAHELTERLA